MSYPFEKFPNELWINWYEEILPSKKILKYKIEQEKTEVQLCKSWLWTNKRTLEWINDFRDWWYHSDNWKFNSLPEIENLHPELFTEEKIPTQNDLRKNVETKEVSIGSMGWLCIDNNF